MRHFHCDWFSKQHVNFVDSSFGPRVMSLLRTAKSDTCSAASQDELEFD